MHAVLSYGFPVLLVGYEWGLRKLLGIDTFSFIGPTLTAAALSFLVPLTKPKNIGSVYSTGKLVIVRRADSNFIAITWLFILLGLFAWSASCVLSNKGSAEKIFNVELHFFIGLVAYIVSLIMVGIKEKV